MVDFLKLGDEKTENWDFEGAVLAYSEAIKICPSKEAYFARGFAKASLKKYDEAIEDFDKALEFDKKYYLALINRGKANFYSFRYKEAMNDYFKVAELDDGKYVFEMIKNRIAKLDKKVDDEMAKNWLKILERCKDENLRLEITKKIEIIRNL